MDDDTGEIFFEEYSQDINQRLIEFKKWWDAHASREPDLYPRTMLPGEWDEQFNLFCSIDEDVLWQDIVEHATSLRTITKQVPDNGSRTFQVAFYTEGTMSVWDQDNNKLVMLCGLATIPRWEMVCNLPWHEFRATINASDAARVRL